MSAIEQHRPSFSREEAQRLARALYSVNGTAKELPSERDQNFKLSADDGRRFVLKISSSAENRSLLELQNNTMIHLAKAGDPVRIPTVWPSLNGNHIEEVTGGRGQAHFVRLLTHLPGTPLASVKPHSAELLLDFGRFLGELDRALTAFDHPVPEHYLPWDIDHAVDILTTHLPLITDPEQNRLVTTALRLFQRRFLPNRERLRTSVIHNDANDHNVLVASGNIAGIIDFGDMLHTYLVCELAVAMAYAMFSKEDPLALGARIVTGYHQILPLQEIELELLFPLICIRLATSVSLSAARKRLTPDNEYLVISEQPAWRLLEQLTEIGPDFAHYLFRQACDLPACPSAPMVTGWLAKNQAKVGPVIDADLSSALIFDLSVGSLDLANPDELADGPAFTRQLFAAMAASDTNIGIGRYDEPRLVYSSDAYKTAGSDGDQWRTIHLGIDLFAAPGTPLLAPLDGSVHSFQNNASHLDYGPTIILEHQVDDVRFYTLYGHLSLDSLEGIQPGQPIARGQEFARIGDISINGGWPPHLHFQVVTDLLGRRGDFPGVVRASQRQIWKSICPNPNLILGIPENKFPAPPRSKSEILHSRSRHLGKSLSVSYRQPIKVVRGWRQYLFDEDGRRYLDCVNNVCHVGHSHPKVVAALSRQAGALNTNTRYLHDNLVEYAERLCRTLPEPLSVCYFVCSGSEANELALRLARSHTGQRDTIVLDGAYHGNTGGLVEISPYKYDGHGGSGAPPHVQKVPMPDPYRGLYRQAEDEIGRKYAAHVAEAINNVQQQGRGISAFVSESLLGCGGQIVLPPGYLEAAFAHVRSAGGVCITDEVQVGFGRVGTHFWGFETQGVVPDIVTMGKPIGNGHPLAAVVTTPEIAASFANGMEYFNTFGGNPVSCAVGLAVLDIIAEENLQQHALETGNYLIDGLQQLQAQHALIGDVRGMGLFVGVELVLDRESRSPAARQAAVLAERLRDHAILVSTDGPDHNVIKLKPPMVFTRQDADRLVTVMAKILAEDALRLA